MLSKLSLIHLGLLLCLFTIKINGSAPTAEEREEIYTETCQMSCIGLTNESETKECNDRFCPNYVSYLLNGVSLDPKPTLVSTNNREVEQFCANWMLKLIKTFGWHQRIRLSLRDCVCAGGKSCYPQRH